MAVSPLLQRGNASGASLRTQQRGNFAYLRGFPIQYIVQVLFQPVEVPLPILFVRFVCTFPDQINLDVVDLLVEGEYIPRHRTGKEVTLALVSVLQFRA